MTVHAATAEAAVLPLPMTAAEVALFQRSGSPRALSSWSKASTMPMTSVLSRRIAGTEPVAEVPSGVAPGVMPGSAGQSKIAVLATLRRCAHILDGVP